MPSCRQLDKAFRGAEQQISKDLIKRKLKLNRNAYWGRVKDKGAFPLNSGTRIKKIRLSRIGFGNMEIGWRKVEDNGCLSNVCERPDADTITHGSSESFYSLENFRVVTDNICLTMMPYRQIPKEELMHIEQGIQAVSQYFWDDWLRTRYVEMCENKQVAFVGDAFLNTDDEPCNVFDIQCNPAITSVGGFVCWYRDPDNNPTLNSQYVLDERYVSVNCPLSSVPAIALLSGDWVENSLVRLQYDDENMPFFDEGVELYDLVTPDIRVSRSMINLERRQESDCIPLVVYKGENISQKLGVKHVIRDYIGMRWDRHALKYYPDYAYNATLAAYSSEDPATWPRFKRVFPYKQVRLANGTTDMVGNEYYQRAPFGISTIFTPNVFGMRGHPTAESIGSAKVGEGNRSYGGEARWRNEYDRSCNPDREIGFWELNFGAGAEPDRPEFGNAFFHRIDLSLKIAGAKCPPNQMGNSLIPMTTDCYNSTQSGETVVGGVTLGANTPRQDVYKYLL